MRRDDIGDHSDTPQEAHQRGGEIAALWAADKTGIIVKGQHAGQTVLAEKLDHHLEEGFRIKIAPHLAVQPDGGPCIDEVGNLDDMLPLALRIGRDSAGIFQVELDFLAWLSEFQRPGLAAATLFNTAGLA